jgi:ABC-type nitrate/sulfonate/bicarbonate transport system substrate-binding protein
MLVALASVAFAIPAQAVDPPFAHVTLVQPALCICGASYYAAQKLGYFKDEGLTVNITYPTLCSSEPGRTLSRGNR